MYMVLIEMILVFKIKLIIEETDFDNPFNLTSLKFTSFNNNTKL